MTAPTTHAHPALQAESSGDRILRPEPPDRSAAGGLSRQRRRLERRIAYWAGRQAEAAARLTALEAEFAAMDLEP